MKTVEVKAKEDLEMVKALEKELINILQSKYGYCGVVNCDNMTMINSGHENIKIKITW